MVSPDSGMSDRADRIDRRLLAAMLRHPLASQSGLADAVGVSRNTVRARLERYWRGRGLRGLDRAVDPAFLGFPLRAFVFTTVEQRRLASVSTALADIPEVLEVNGISGDVDLIVDVVARDADDLYRVAGAILGIPGVERTSTALVMRPLVPYRVKQLLD
ncbi:Lrp/AsnC family transcriptional regulator [Ruicaihuangia caeni]|uniref:Lrp/AsnC family transcriptional regulator n=1 Tax=Ruicaihuangia caeni TaxID=3042517 RepID=A0AAW6TC74_9MICO|nr:Lrp/AsnC family transcriptional regulator [Klugiella sp. YN-L-19]MDI2099610.1 Lrp/AsnC family transcriptional regulator [Klugiella sp. YN-L-19]